SSNKDLQITWFTGVDLDKGRSTSVGYYDIPMPADVPALLNKEWQTVLLDKFASSPPKGLDGKTNVAKFRKVTVGKYAGLESESSEDNAFLAVRYVIVGKRMFLLSVEAKNAQDGRPLAATFFGSFEVLPKLARTAEFKAPPWERFDLPGGGSVL